MEYRLLKKIIYISLAVLLLTACHNDPPVIVTGDTNQQDLRENMINANRMIAQSEETAINEYIARRKWPMTKLPGGVRLWEYEKVSNTTINMEDSVTVNYTIEAINGKLIYRDIEENFVVGHRRDMIGLDEAIMNLHHNSKAKVILPSHLAYGIGGDGDRIPQSAVLIIDLQIENQQ